MKHLIIAILLMCSLSGSCQTITKMTDSVYVVVPDRRVGTFIHKDSVYPLFRSPKGKLYYYKLSKKNVFYKVYPKIQ